MATKPTDDGQGIIACKAQDVPDGEQKALHSFSLSRDGLKGHGWGVAVVALVVLIVFVMAALGLTLPA